MAFYPELATAFPWYTVTVEKQNRNKGHCQGICPFQYFSQLNKIPTFLFNANTNTVVDTSGITFWEIWCESDDFYLDITAKKTNLQVTVANGSDYIYYDGDDLSITLPCGYYYMKMTAGGQTFYSEVFYVKDFTAYDYIQDTDKTLFSAWPWYDNQLKQTRNKAYCKSVCDYYFIWPSTNLPQFIFKRTAISFSSFNRWILRDVDETCEYELDVSLLKFITIDGYDYIYYTGEDITLPCGKFESIITIDGLSYYSELIHIQDNLNDIIPDTNYILQENGFILLQENGSGLLWQ